MVLSSTGQKAAQKMMAILEASPMPKNSRKTGNSARAGA
jgi:hypothetical protein